MNLLTLLSRTLVLVPLFALIALGGQAPPGSNWETARMLPSGTDVRVVAGTAKAVSGKLTSVSDAELAMHVGAGPRTFDRAQIVSVAVKKKGHRLRNTLIGFGVGLAAGIGIGVAAGHGCNGILCGLADVVGGAIVGTAGGTVAGAVWPTGGWRKVYEK